MTLMGFGFPKEEREYIVAARPGHVSDAARVRPAVPKWIVRPGWTRSSGRRWRSYLSTLADVLPKYVIAEHPPRTRTRP